MQRIHNKKNEIAREQWSEGYGLKELDIIHLLILGITCKATSSSDEVLSNKQARYIT